MWDVGAASQAAGWLIGFIARWGFGWLNINTVQYYFTGDLFEKEAPCLHQRYNSVTLPTKQRQPPWLPVGSLLPEMTLGGLANVPVSQLVPCHPCWQSDQVTAIHVRYDALHHQHLACFNVGSPGHFVIAQWSVFILSKGHCWCPLAST